MGFTRKNKGKLTNKQKQPTPSNPPIGNFALTPSENHSAATDNPFASKDNPFASKDNPSDAKDNPSDATDNPFVSNKPLFQSKGDEPEYDESKSYTFNGQNETSQETTPPDLFSDKEYRTNKTKVVDEPGLYRGRLVKKYWEIKKDYLKGLIDKLNTLSIEDKYSQSTITKLTEQIFEVMTHFFSKHEYFIKHNIALNDLNIELANKGHATNDLELISKLLDFLSKSELNAQDVENLTSDFNNNFKAKVILGYCYRKEIGVEKDNEKALKFFTEAYENEKAVGEFGHSDAANNIGLLNCLDIFESLDHIEKGDEKFLMPKEQKQKHKAAYEHFLSAANKDHPDALYNLSMLYGQGKIVNQDIIEQYILLEKAAAGGIIRAKRILAEFLRGSYDSSIKFKGMGRAKTINPPFNLMEIIKIYYDTALILDEDRSFQNKNVQNYLDLVLFSLTDNSCELDIKVQVLDFFIARLHVLLRSENVSEFITAYNNTFLKQIENQHNNPLQTKVFYSLIMNFTKKLLDENQQENNTILYNTLKKKVERLNETFLSTDQKDNSKEGNLGNILGNMFKEFVGIYSSDLSPESKFTFLKGLDDKESSIHSLQKDNNLGTKNIKAIFEFASRASNYKKTFHSNTSFYTEQKSYLINEFIDKYNTLGIEDQEKFSSLCEETFEIDIGKEFKPAHFESIIKNYQDNMTAGSAQTDQELIKKALSEANRKNKPKQQESILTNIPVQSFAAGFRMSVISGRDLHK